MYDAGVGREDRGTSRRSITVILFHVTHRRNCKGIDKHGLLPDKAIGKEKSVWLVTKTSIPWAVMHTLSKPGRGPLADLVVYRVEVPRARLPRFKQGVWRCFDVVRPIDREPAATYAVTYPSDWPGTQKGMMVMIGDQVRQAAERAIGAGLVTQAELSRRVGLSEAQVSRFLRGERSLSAESIDRILAALGLEITLTPQRTKRGE